MFRLGGFFLRTDIDAVQEGEIQCCSDGVIGSCGEYHMTSVVASIESFEDEG